MTTTSASGVRLFYELGGHGDVPLVLVHGSWGSHHGWDAVAPGLRQTFRVLTYDRRGHSDSEHPSGQGSVGDDVTDLAALIEHLGLAPAWVAGNSFGASIALRLAGDPALASMIEEVGRRIGAVVERIGSGDHAGAAEQFVDTVALGPGAWAQLPAPIQQTFIENAPTFLDEARDPEQLTLDLGALKAFPRPVLLTKGEASPPMFAPVIAKLRAAVPLVDVVTFAGAGHIPHVTHADVYIEALTGFIGRNTA